MFLRVLIGGLIIGIVLAFGIASGLFTWRKNESF